MYWFSYIQLTCLRHHTDCFIKNDRFKQIEGQRLSKKGGGHFIDRCQSQQEV